MVFDIPQTVLDNKKCDLSIALFIFYRADGLSYLEDKTDNANLPQWYFKFNFSALIFSC